MDKELDPSNRIEQTGKTVSRTCTQTSGCLNEFPIIALDRENGGRIDVLSGLDKLGITTFIYKNGIPEELGKLIRQMNPILVCDRHRD
jgi:hypothetical protein